MAKAYTFEGFPINKSYGDCTAPVEIIVVKNATNKADARAVADKNFSEGLRTVNAGRAHPNERAAVDHAAWCCGLYNRNKKNNRPDCTWFAVDLEPAAMANSIRRQRSIAAFLGI
jgi:hypothetical protein